MDKELVKRLLTTNKIDLVDLNSFITEYTFEKKNRHITPQELNAIVSLIQNGIFNLRFALQEAANSLGLTVMTAASKDGVILRTEVY